MGIQQLMLTVWFYITWLLCVKLGNKGALWSTIGFFIFYRLILKRSGQQYIIWLIMVLIGVSIDTLLMWVGVFMFPSNHGWFIIPFWLLILWVWFSLTVVELCVKLIKLPWYYQNIIGGIGGTSSYILGHVWQPQRLQFGLPLYWTIAIIFTIWAVLFWLFLQLTKHYYHA